VDERGAVLRDRPVSPLLDILDCNDCALGQRKIPIWALFDIAIGGAIINAQLGLNDGLAHTGQRSD